MKTIISSLFLFISLISFSQGNPAFSLFQQNGFWYNPAHCALQRSNIFSLSGKNQWMNTVDNPKTALFSFEKALDSTRKHAVGFIAMYDQWGNSITQQAGISYRYRQKLTSKMNLNFGIHAFAINHTIDFSKFIFTQPEPLFPTEKMSSLRPSIDAGMELENNNIWHVGISAKNVNYPTYAYNSLKVRYSRDFFFTADYKTYFGTSSSITPSVFIHVSSPSFGIILNTTYSYKEKVFLGLSFKGFGNSNPIVISAGFEINKRLLIMGAYDISRTTLGSSYEAILKYKF